MTFEPAAIVGFDPTSPAHHYALVVFRLGGDQMMTAEELARSLAMWAGTVIGFNEPGRRLPPTVDPASVPGFVMTDNDHHFALFLLEEDLVTLRAAHPGKPDASLHALTAMAMWPGYVDAARHMLADRRARNLAGWSPGT